MFLSAIYFTAPLLLALPCEIICALASAISPSLIPFRLEKHTKCIYLQTKFVKLWFCLLRSSRGQFLSAKKKILNVCSCLLQRFTATGNVCCSFSAGSSLVADDALPPGDAMRAMSSYPPDPHNAHACCFCAAPLGSSSSSSGHALPCSH